MRCSIVDETCSWANHQPIGAKARKVAPHKAKAEMPAIRLPFDHREVGSEVQRQKRVASIRGSCMRLHVSPNHRAAESNEAG